jgi:glycosyltransferase involved in cell wall biosynthesis
MGRIKILRPYRDTGFISAGAFEHIFARNLAPDLDIRKVPQSAWFHAILGAPNGPVSLQEAARKLSAATRRFHFFCPAYESQMLAPVFLALRNRAGADIRLLFIAHAPGASVMEWVLMRPLMQEGDIIIAPSHSAKETILYLCPELNRFVRVIPHPMHALPRVQPTHRNAVVTLARIHPGKLLHRQIEAMAVLRRRGIRMPVMDIAGPLADGDSAAHHPYARSLAARIRRLRLENFVRLMGAVIGDENKARYIANARMMLYLSVTIEEAFPKSSVEALGLGVPVVSTRWNGFLETVGECGKLVPVQEADGGLTVDASAEAIADAMEAVMDSPPSAEACREHASQFLPERVRPAYRQALEAALDVAYPSNLSDAGMDGSAAPASGLLSVTAPLSAFSWQEMFAMHLTDTAHIRMAWVGRAMGVQSKGARLRAILLEGTKKPLERFLGKLNHAPWMAPTGGSPRPHRDPADFFSRMACGSFAKATQTSRQVCLLALANAGRTELLFEGLEQMRKEGMSSIGLKYLTVEYYRQTGNFSKAFTLAATGELANLQDENAAMCLRQLSRICREWGRPRLALPRLRKWLRRFPDAPDSGPVWLDRCVNALYADSGEGPQVESRQSLSMARCLLGDSPVIQKIERIHGVGRRFDR